MVKVRSDKNMIVMTRGDTLILNIDITDAEGNAYEPAETDQLRFALKKNYEDEDTIILKDIPIDTLQLRVESSETKLLDQPESYYFDIQLTYGDNIVDTIISGKLKTVEEVE